MKNYSLKLLLAIAVISGIFIGFYIVEEKNPVGSMQNNDSDLQQRSDSLIAKTSSSETILKPVERSWLEESGQKLLDCYHLENCDYPQSDPRAYFYAVGKDMVELLVKAQSEAETDQVSEQQLRTLAHQLIDIPNGHVQSKALEILNKLPVNNESFIVIHSVLKDNFDSVLLKKALGLITKYHQQGFSSEIDTMFQTQLQTGGHFVKQELSARILPFLNENNFESYQETANNLSSATLEFRQLTSALEEYLLRKRRG